jgi:hypothetical protein
MDVSREFMIDGRKRRGKKRFDTFVAICNGEPVHKGGHKEDPLTTKEEVIAYLVRHYEWACRVTGENRFAGRSTEDIFFRCLGYRILFKPLGLILALRDGDFGHLYRATQAEARLEYAKLYWELRNGEGFGSRSGVGHATYSIYVTYCLACKRPDLARRFYPRELGLVSGKIPLSRLDNLIIGMMHDNGQWKKNALQDAKRWINGKRGVSQEAAVQYMIHLYENSAKGMSEMLALLMKLFHRTPWLIGEESADALHAFYLTAKLYCDYEAFRQIKRPSGPGWWDEYVDLCLCDPMPADLDEPFIIFPEPIAFLNEALRFIEQPYPAAAFPLRVSHEV